MPVRRIRVSADALPASLEKFNRGLKKATIKGVIKGARNGKGMLKNSTPESLGDAKAGWEMKYPANMIIQLYNGTPYVGVLEWGARPHNVSREGMERLVDWSKRELGLSEDDAKRAAFGIASKIRDEGQKGTFFVRMSIPALVEACQKFVTKELASYGSRFRG